MVGEKMRNKSILQNPEEEVHILGRKRGNPFVKIG